MEPFYNERRFSYMAGEAEQGMAVGQFLKERGEVGRGEAYQG